MNKREGENARLVAGGKGLERGEIGGGKIFVCPSSSYTKLLSIYLPLWQKPDITAPRNTPYLSVSGEHIKRS